MQGKVQKGFFVFLLCIIFDGIALLLLTDIAVKFRSYIMPEIIPNLPIFNHSIRKYIWLNAIQLSVFFYEGLYTKRFTFWEEIKTLWKATIVSTAIVFLILFVTKQSEGYSRLVIIQWSALSFLFLPLLRPAFKKFIFKTGAGKTRLLIIGAGENGIRFLKAIRQEPNLGYEVAGFVDNTVKEDEIYGIKVYRFMNSIERYLQSSNINAIAITITSTSEGDISDLITRLRNRVDTVLYVPEIKDIPVAGTEPRYFFKEDIFALEIKNNLENPVNYYVKRGIDYTISFLLLPFIIPIIIILSFLIKITSRGPAIFSQERIGKDGKGFKCYKFRTMYQDAEERLREILEKDPVAKEEWDRTWKLKNDPRVTPIGRFLRKTSLDELPQIFNVLKGEMSLVGPRPVVKDELEQFYKENSTFYFLVPPGITGLWQVSGRSNTTYEERVALDCWYVRNWSLWLDIVILLKTIKVIIKKEGAY